MPDLAVRESLSAQMLLGPGVTAVRKYWKPFVLLQAAAFALVLAFYTNSTTRQFCGELSELKLCGGFLFSAIAAAIAGSLLPEVAKAIMLDDRRLDRNRMANIAFTLLGFAGNGILADLQYRALAWVFGYDNHILTVLKKILVDQFILTPAYSLPYWMLLYLWRSNQFDLLQTARDITPRWFISRLLPLLIPAWCFWIPMVTMLYALPSDLQFLLFTFALAGWSLIMVFVASQEAIEPVAPPLTPLTPAA